MSQKPIVAVALGLLLAIVATAIGQTLLNDTQPDTIPEPIPTRGMTMEIVEARFGAPASRRAPVGDPPITRWEYPQFIVYFEYKRVIHSVAKRPRR